MRRVFPSGDALLALPRPGRSPNQPRQSRSPWQVLVFAAGVVSVLLALVLRPIVRWQVSARVTQTLHQAELAIESGKPQRAVELAQLALLAARRSGRFQGRCLTALGLAYGKLAEQAPPAEQLKLYTLAAKYLGQATQAELPAAEYPKLKHYLGICLYRQGAVARSLPLLLSSVRSYPQGRSDALALLTRIYLDGPQRDLDRARHFYSELIREPKLSPEQLTAAWKAKDEILRRQAKPNLLAGLEPSPIAADQEWGQVILLAQDHCESKRYGQAVDVLRGLLASPGLSRHVNRRARYLLAVAAQEQGDLQTAVSDFGRLVRSHPDTEEARAAAVRAAAILLRQGETEQAITWFEYAVRQRAPGSTESQAISDDGTLAHIIKEAMDQLSSSDQFKQALRLLASYRAVAPRAKAEVEAANLHERWAEAKLQQADSLPAVQAALDRYRGLELYRTAGTLLSSMADSASSPVQAGSLRWRAAEDLVKGESYLAAYKVLEKLLADGPPGEMRAKALALACTALEASGRCDLVRRLASTCVSEFPDQPAALNSRYRLALCLIASGEVDQAEQALRKNLETPGAEAADDGMLEATRLTLARLLRDQGRSEEATLQLRELLVGQADHDTLFQARWLLAECLQQLAGRPAQRLERAQTAQARSHYRRRKEQLLAEALEQLGNIQQELSGLEEEGRASIEQLEKLRNCRWQIAECLYEMERYESAIAAFEFLSRSDEPSEWLRAQLQIASCYQRMGRTLAAGVVLRAAKEEFEQMPSEMVEQARIGMNPGRWQEWLDWVKRR